MYHQVSRGDKHRTRRGAAGHEDGRQDGREAGHGAGHERYLMDARGRSGRHAREEKPTSRPNCPVPGPVDRSTTGRQPDEIYRTGQKPESCEVSGFRPVDRTTDRPARSTARSTGSQTGPVRVCLDQIYSGSVILVSFRPELVPDAYISALDDPLAALDHV